MLPEADIGSEKAVKKVPELFQNLTDNLISLLIYGAIVISMALGFVKCVFPLRRLARCFRRAIHNLAVFKPQESGRPDWQDALFLGKPMRKQWTRFLVNAEQLDQRGLSCDVEDYINDQEIFPEYAHLQLSEVIPGLLTSLGILGTFIGLMRGLGELDLTSAERTMSSITTMIGGMRFAYGTSIAGLTASLVFNVLFRMAQGSATSALDDFNEAFADAVMQRPLDEQVRATCYQEDQALFLNGAFGEINHKLETGIGVAIDRAFAPIGQNMNAFIMAETQAQVEGLNHIVNEFVSHLNQALNGQFVQLAKTMSQLNQAQTVSIDSVNHAMSAADTIMDSIQRTSLVSQTVIERFDGYIAELGQAQAGSAELSRQTAELLSGMYEDLKEQNERYKALQAAQSELGDQMQQYAVWSGRVLEAVEKQSDKAAERSHELANEMSKSGKLLQDSYASFVENIATGLARTMGLFEENMRDMTQEMVDHLKKAIEAGGGKGSSLDLQQFSRVQQALSDMTQALGRATKAAERMAEGA
ncbi:MAG: MotA/TolQ/ExbB proton channel family protein [Christensenellales bacterium]|jgi:hypothetical protein